MKFRDLLKGAIVFLLANPIFAYVIFGLILVLAIAGYINSCRSEKALEKDKENQQIIEQDKGKIEVTEDERNAQIINNNVAAKESENAAANFNRVQSVDSRGRESNFGAVRRKWCADHPNDSACR